MCRYILLDCRKENGQYWLTIYDKKRQWLYVESLRKFRVKRPWYLKEGFKRKEP